MTDRKIDWGSYRPMTEIEKKAASQQDARAVNPSTENEIIFREWYAQDEADAARWDMALRHLDYDNEFHGDDE